MGKVNSGLYTAYSGMQAQLDALEILANNLANVNTPAFKEQNSFFAFLNKSIQAIDETGGLEKAVNQSIVTRGTTNMMGGSLTATNRDLDVAIEGNGFLVVQAANGIRYTRNGNLHLNNKYILTTSDGFPVMGAANNRPITLGPGMVQINSDGQVSLDGEQVDRLKVVSFEDLSLLEKEGNSLFISREGQSSEKSSDAKIKPGYLEQSNVNPVSSVVKMVEVLRHFEAIQKSIAK